jgi:uncharacterized membrane protein YkoI
MKKKWFAVIGSGALVITIAFAGVSIGVSMADSDDSEIHNGTIRVEKQSEAEFPSMAKISMDQAIQKALASVQGLVLKTELEDENGFLVYGVEVATADKVIMDVKVDAGSGKVLAMDQDTVDKNERGGYRDRDEDENEHEVDRDRED